MMKGFSEKRVRFFCSDYNFILLAAVGGEGVESRDWRMLSVFINIFFFFIHCEWEISTLIVVQIEHLRFHPPFDEDEDFVNFQHT